MGWTEEEKSEFVRLLQKVADQGYWLPDEAMMMALHSICSRWAVELVITRQREHGLPEVLLTVYDGGAEKFKGQWHIPGGYELFLDSDIQAVCSRIAKRELTMDVQYLEVLDVYKWQAEEHPYGRPLSLYVRCLPEKTIQETEGMRFFTSFTLPSNLIGPHRRFIESYLLYKY